MSARLLGVAGPFQGTTFLLPAGEVAVGRDPSNDMWVSDPALSRRQCLLVGKGDQFIIRDLGSRNGTQVNGVPVEEHRLSHGDQIFVGDSVLVFLLKEDEVHSHKSPVEISETAAPAGQTVLLRPEDSLYLHSEAMANLPPANRLSQNLNSLLKIATGIGGIRDRESLQWQLLGFIFEIVPADRGAVLLFDQLGEFSSAIAWDRIRGPGQPVRVSRTIVQRVARESIGLVVKDVSDDQTLRQVATLADQPVRSLLCVPLLISDKVLGALYLDSGNPALFDEDHLQVMTAVAGIASLAFDNVRHWEQLQRENQDLRAEISLEHNMVGVSSRMKDVYEFIRRAAPTDSTVLIQGESGTGKELVARAIHRNSSRADRPFVAINCAAITETLLESELFGHEKGAFTGAVSQKKGKMEVAEGGTLFLDEVSELAPGLQAKLLRVLQEREFERVGGTRPIKLDVRLIAASNRNLPDAIEAGTFRRDLYYRLNVVAVTMPALRDRRVDIPLLVEHFIAKASRKCKSRIKPLSAEARVCLTNYDWPGNVRELENAIERALVMGSSDVILPEDLPEAIVDTGSATETSTAKFVSGVKDTKKQLILAALQQTNGSYIEAAKILGMHPNSLLRLIRNLDLKAAVRAGSSSGFE